MCVCVCEGGKERWIDLKSGWNNGATHPPTGKRGGVFGRKRGHGALRLFQAMRCLQGCRAVLGWHKVGSRAANQAQPIGRRHDKNDIDDGDSDDSGFPIARYRTWKTYPCRVSSSISSTTYLQQRQFINNAGKKGGGVLARSLFAMTQPTACLAG